MKIPPIAMRRSRFVPPFFWILQSAIIPSTDPTPPNKLLGINGSGSVQRAINEIRILAMASQLRLGKFCSVMVIFNSSQNGQSFSFSFFFSSVPNN
jgi:hypothetical protein